VVQQAPDFSFASLSTESFIIIYLCYFKRGDLRVDVSCVR